MIDEQLARSNQAQQPVALLFATSGHSGVDRVVRNLVAEFAHLPLQFHLLSIRGHGPYLSDLPGNVRPVRLRAAHRNTVLPALIAYLIRHRPRALFTASHRLNRAALLARAMAQRDMPVAIRMGMSLKGMFAEMRPRKARKLARSMRRWYPRADAVIAPSTGVGEDLRELAGVSAERLHVIPNPIVSPALHAQALESLHDSWLRDGRTQEIPVVLAAGSLEPRKDFVTLIRAFGMLRAQRPARLIILGEGRERHALEGLIKELGLEADVRMPGFQNNPYAWMSRANVFALTSRREGSGAVLAEALACGTPVISTDCPTGPAEILGHGTYGALVPVGDANAVSQALSQALSGAPSPATLAAAAECFSTHSAARAYLKALDLY